MWPRADMVQGCRVGAKTGEFVKPAAPELGPAMWTRALAHEVAGGGGAGWTPKPRKLVSGGGGAAARPSFEAGGGGEDGLYPLKWRRPASRRVI